MKRLLSGLLAVLFLAVPTYGTQIVRQFKPLKLNTTLEQKQFKPITAVVIKKPIKANLFLRPIVTTTPAKPAGPDPKAAIDLADMIDDTDLLEDLAMTCGWDPHLIFQDKAAGNVFYYLPRGFLLVHDPENGYGLNVQYNHLTDPEKPSVMITAELLAPHHTGDILVLKSILKQAFDLKASDKLTLNAISGIGATADMQGMTAGLALAPERISITLPSHLKKSFRLTLALNQDETEEVLAQIAGQGLSGNLNVKVGDASVPVPIHIQYLNFSGNRVDGFTQWVENRPLGVIRNLTNFPVKLSSINCYKVNNGKLERISKNLKASTLLPGGKKAFKLPTANTVFGNNILLAWLGTSLDSDCPDCMKTVDRDVRKGVATAPSSRIKFEVIPDVFSDLDVYKIIVQVQSPYFTAGKGKVITREVELTQENNMDQDLVIYTPEGKGAEPLLYRYRIKLINGDGTFVLEESWHDSRTTSQFFGASHLEPIMGTVKEDQ
ncbi:MAG: hypothetical protein KKE44_11840 [Proteobacteria bacterium]|nr:hypothetical protein [Pseudomonadota bacterium]MBU1583416.1 hypothetical protein [Pseudomonadota bacterium]MBU2452767.1 hypothetical protein [Pseudomonadota bacterium]MBU2628594.1 hypothetical protein [Pseudomonadota bacterium]